MENNNINEEFSQELSDLKWQFESMQQIFGNLENTISQAKKSSDNEDDSKDSKEDNSGMFSKESGKESSSKENKGKEDKGQEAKGKEDKSKEGGSNKGQSNENSSRQERPNKENNMRMTNGTLKLSDQIHDFMKETQTQQANVQQEIQRSIQQAMDILNQANIQIQTNQALIMMNQFINQAEQQINHITHNTRSGESKKNSQIQSQRQGQDQLN